jgi:hypothetical protein
MLPDIVQIHDRSTQLAENALSFRSGAMTGRFRELCLHRLDTERTSISGPIDRAGRAEHLGGDPAVSAIEEWRAARHAYRTHRREIEPLWNAVPEWVRNWHGVYAGRAERPDGQVSPVLARTEDALNDSYDRRVRDADTPEAADRIEKRRREALAELRLTLAAEKGACRAAGLPFERDSEDDYWHGFRERIERAQAAVESTPARSGRGIEARCRHAARLIDDLPSDGADQALAGHLKSVLLRIARDVADIVSD